MGICCMQSAQYGRFVILISFSNLRWKSAKKYHQQKNFLKFQPEELKPGLRIQLIFPMRIRIQLLSQRVSVPKKQKDCLKVPGTVIKPWSQSKFATKTLIKLQLLQIFLFIFSVYEGKLMRIHGCPDQQPWLSFEKKC